MLQKIQDALEEDREKEILAAKLLSVDGGPISTRPDRRPHQPYANAWFPLRFTRAISGEAVNLACFCETTMEDRA